MCAKQAPSLEVDDDGLEACMARLSVREEPDHALEQLPSVPNHNIKIEETSKNLPDAKQKKQILSPISC